MYGEGGARARRGGQCPCARPARALLGPLPAVAPPKPAPRGPADMTSQNYPRGMLWEAPGLPEPPPGGASRTSSASSTATAEGDGAVYTSDEFRWDAGRGWEGGCRSGAPAGPGPGHAAAPAARPRGAGAPPDAPAAAAASPGRSRARQDVLLQDPAVPREAQPRLVRARGGAGRAGVAGVAARPAGRRPRPRRGRRARGARRPAIRFLSCSTAEPPPARHCAAPARRARPAPTCPARTPRFAGRAHAAFRRPPAPPPPRPRRMCHYAHAGERARRRDIRKHSYSGEM
jgi:hypothetical protein